MDFLRAARDDGLSVFQQLVGLNGGASLAVAALIIAAVTALGHAAFELLEHHRSR